MRTDMLRQLAIGFAVFVLIVPTFADDTPDEPASTTAAEDTRSEDADPQVPAEDAPDDADKDESAVSDEDFLQDPFSYLQSDMQSAVMDLKEGETKPPATVTQPRILSRFDMLIEELERQGQGAGSPGQNVNRPAQQSTLQRGPGGQNEMRAPRDDGRDWANLTPKERQKILQSRTDGFPAGYDNVLADYFRRVARAQQPSSDSPVDVPAEPDLGGAKE